MRIPDVIKTPEEIRKSIDSSIIEEQIELMQEEKEEDA